MFNEIDLAGDGGEFVRTERLLDFFLGISVECEPVTFALVYLSICFVSRSVDGIRKGTVVSSFLLLFLSLEREIGVDGCDLVPSLARSDASI